jgi:hypothetical protein
MAQAVAARPSEDVFARMMQASQFRTAIGGWHAIQAEGHTSATDPMETDEKR